MRSGGRKSKKGEVKTCDNKEPVTGNKPRGARITRDERGCARSNCAEGDSASWAKLISTLAVFRAGALSSIFFP